MPHYHFNFRNGALLPDKHGMELPDQMSARVRATKLVSEKLCDEADIFWNRPEWHIEVTDETGLILFSLYVLAVSSAAQAATPSAAAAERR
jgi:hypothetical protein